jgi:NAD+ synthase (glutamine-hydrolysing)
MCYYLVKEYGINKAAFKLGITETVTSVREIVSKILTCVYQSTENSSEITLNAAKVVAEKIGANFYSISIDEINKKYISSFSNLICKNPSWSDSDISLQNIQARVRSPGIWFLANLTNSLLLTTGNRSESAVGYTTMDGDSSGSLAPIAGVSKTFILNWLKWLQRGNLRDIMDFAWLEVITSQSPTAELRPLSSHQTDEKDLMPYPVLEYLEESFLLNRLSKEQVVEDIKNKFPTTDFNDLVKYIDKFLLLWKTSQWKRERLAPSFHLDTFSVDSRSWLRFPILSGGIN